MVGIQIRRTDKLLKEAGFHKVEEYIKYVEEYYQQIEIKFGYQVLPKHVYVASDDPTVLAECKTKFPEYKFLGNPAQPEDISSRYSLTALQRLISDIHMLSLSDFIVCTSSSNVCRLAYEIQQQRYVDGSWRFKRWTCL